LHAGRRKPIGAAHLTASAVVDRRLPAQRSDGRLREGHAEKRVDACGRGLLPDEALAFDLHLDS
jgi:hypothetical protein